MPAKDVLIVEDERPIREMIAFGLRRAGFEVREAEDCRSARAAVANRRAWRAFEVRFAGTAEAAVAHGL